MIPNDIYRTFIETGNAKAEAYYAYQQLDSQTKSILAQLTLAAKHSDQASSMAEATQIALATDQFTNHLRDVSAARLAFDLADVKYKATDALFQAQRTVQASERAALHSAT